MADCGEALIKGEYLVCIPVNLARSIVVILVFSHPSLVKCAMPVKTHCDHAQVTNKVIVYSGSSAVRYPLSIRSRPFDMIGRA